MSYVFDTSSLVAITKNEPGADIALSCLSSAVMSTVNYAEAMTNFTKAGFPESEATALMQDVPLELVPLSAEHAVKAGQLVALTKKHGLSLGDRCCLALALERGAAVVTADRIWAELAEPLGLDIIITRP